MVTTNDATYNNPSIAPWILPLSPPPRARQAQRIESEGPAEEGSLSSDVHACVMVHHTRIVLGRP